MVTRNESIKNINSIIDEMMLGLRVEISKHIIATTRRAFIYFACMHFYKKEKEFDEFFSIICHKIYDILKGSGYELIICNNKYFVDCIIEDVMFNLSEEVKYEI